MDSAGGKRPVDDLKDALDHLRKAADSVVDRIVGSEVGGHLREAARHTLKAVRGAVERAEQQLDERCARDRKPPSDPPAGGGPGAAI